MNVEKDSNKEFSAYVTRRYPTRGDITTSPEFGEYNAASVFEPYEINGGSVINVFIEVEAYGSIAFKHTFNRELTASEDYDSVKDWFDAEVRILSEWASFADTILLTGYKGIFSANGETFTVRPNRDGTSSRDIHTRVKFDVSFSRGNLIFETDPILEPNTPFFKTPEKYRVIDGEHEFEDHILTRAFNCFSFGNGVESNRIRDAFNENSFSIDSSPTAVSEVEYKQIRRFADITYSGVFNSNSNVNKLNEFNLSLANYKEDMDKSYGKIVKIKGTDNNLEVRQEDKCSTVLYGKDLLYNADGSTNLTKVEYVLGEQQMTPGEYGISYHAESFDEYGTNTYFTDTKRGVVLKDNFNNGLFEISSQGMNSYFKKLFRDNIINNIIGEYDQHHDVYVLNIKMNNNANDYVTWVYSDKDNGWLGRITFNPEDMCRVNGKFLSFYNGEIYEHNQPTGRNTFYGTEYLSKFVFNFSQAPSERKIYKSLLTDLDSGQIDKTDFVNQEGVKRAYIRTSNSVLDSSNLSVQGIGNCTLSGLVLTFAFRLEDEISIGDTVLNQANLVVGKIVSKTAKTLTLDAVANFVSGNYVMISKDQRAESRGLLGYHLQVSAQLMKNTKTEVYAVNTNTTKSYV
jgi:hypothetical protein